ncbi:MAG: PEGA domain-containing protein [Gammaproteobacteria bacterium]|nr:PEGA domain-containing protein [Gammaproteobacteria bacterium]
MSPLTLRQVSQRRTNTQGFVTQAFSNRDRIALRSLPCSLVLVFWFLAGCSTIPENVTLVIESKPSGANVVSSEGWRCSTPCTRSVPRESQFDLKLTQTGYQPVEQAVEIPELKPSRIGTYIGTSVGVVAGFVVIDLGEAIGAAIFDVLFAGLFGPFELSTSEKLEAIARSTLVFGGAGYVIDRIRDGQRAKRAHLVNVVLVEHEADEEQGR